MARRKESALIPLTICFAKVVLMIRPLLLLIGYLPVFLILFISFYLIGRFQGDLSPNLTSPSSRWIRERIAILTDKGRVVIGDPNLQIGVHVDQIGSRVERYARGG